MTDGMFPSTSKQLNAALKAINPNCMQIVEICSGVVFVKIDCSNSYILEAAGCRYRYSTDELRCGSCQIVQGMALI
jgi:hypothetical protein